MATMYSGMKCLNNSAATYTMLWLMIRTKVSYFFPFCSVVVDFFFFLFVGERDVDRVVGFIVLLSEERRMDQSNSSSSCCLKKEEKNEERRIKSSRKEGWGWDCVILIHSLHPVSTLCCVFSSSAR